MNLIPVTQWPPGVADMILSRVEGNPLYLEEVVRSLINDGLLTQLEDGRWQFNETITSITVPDTLEGVLLARLDRLEELCRWTVQMASVVGRSFPFDVVAHTANELNNMAVTSYLDELQLVEIVREAQRNPELVYAFIHSLMQEVSYSSLAASARREYHRLIAAYLEDGRTQGWGRTESLPALIAHHAYEGEDWPRALRYQMQAGQQAQALFANQAAIDHYRKALHAASQIGWDVTKDKQLAIHQALSHLYIDTGKYDESLEHLSKGHHMALDEGLDEALITICRWYSRLYELRGDYPEALYWIDQGLAIESQSGTAEFAHLLILAGLINIRQGKYDIALQQCEQVLQIAKPLGEVAVLARAYGLLGYIYWRNGNNTAINYFQEAFNLYRQVSHIQGQAQSHNMIANACFSLGRWAEAEHHYLQAHQMFDQLGDTYNLAVADNNLGGIALKRGQFDSALLFYEEGLKLAQQIGSSAWLVGGFHMNLGYTYVNLEKVEDARSHLQASQSYFEQAKSREFLPELLRHQAEASFLADELDLAQSQIENSLKVAQELETHGEEAISRGVQGRIAYARGDLLAAEESLRVSVESLFQIEDEYELARSRYWLSVVLVELGNKVEARPLLTQAAAAFERLEAQADLTAVTHLQNRL
ncbi:MAG: tetratricopeptide repeat protein [Anaerolineae bacterium]|nr:tetratricopeptide repeat protein [Anaerolineae bacterium]